MSFLGKIMDTMRLNDDEDDDYFLDDDYEDEKPAKKSLFKKQTADDLDVLTASNRKIFLERSNMDEQQLTDMMEAETFLTPDDCLEYGLIDKIEDYGHAPENAAGEELQKRYQEVMQHMKETKSFKEQLELMQKNNEPKTPAQKPEETKNTLQEFLQNFSKGE